MPGAHSNCRYRRSGGCAIRFSVLLAWGESASPSRPNRTDDHGVGQETEVPVYGMLQWKPTQKSAIGLMGGVALAGNVRVEDSDGGFIHDDDYNAAPFISLNTTPLRLTPACFKRRML